MSIGKNIAYLRKLRNLTQEQLGEALGVTNQAVSKWEMETSMPDVMMLPDLAKFFKVEISDLYDEDISQKISRKNVHNGGKKLLNIDVDRGEHGKVKLKVPTSVASLLSAFAVEEEGGDIKMLADMLSGIEDTNGEIMDVTAEGNHVRIYIEDYDA